ncbi:MAG: type III polyketide synthase [Bacteroidetes bacterium]|nr:MAG: type III polyketide synthase [Bacteroidota bacterium]
MQKTHLVAIGTANPPYQIPQSSTADFMIQKLQLDTQEARKLKIIYRATAIDARYSVIDDYLKTKDFSFYPNDNSAFPSTEKRMKIYEQNACNLAIQAIENAISPEIYPKITHLITVSCTGMYAPGLDIELTEKLPLSSHVQRTCINFMGCYASFNALKYADLICKAVPNAKVLIVGVEMCTLHLQFSKKDDDLVSNALFADGAAAVFLEANSTAEKTLILEDFYCDLAFQGKKDMAWNIGDFGFQMQLSSYVADLLQEKSELLITNLLKNSNIDLSDIGFFAIHPGGKRILEKLEQVLKITKVQNQFSYDILQNFGNMSSVTVLFVLKKLLESLEKNDHKKKVLSMAFGPGLTLESALLTTNVN